jgi:hypothetical protein
VSYEEFSARYGDADTGFAANGVIYGAANDRLEEPEIVNYYYLEYSVQRTCRDRNYRERSKRIHLRE